MPRSQGHLAGAGAMVEIPSGRGSFSYCQRQSPKLGGGVRYKYFSFFPAPIIQSPVGASHETITRILLLRKHECHNLQGSVPWDTEEGRTGGLSINGASDQHSGSCDTNQGKVLPRNCCDHVAQNGIEGMEGT